MNERWVLASMCGVVTMAVVDLSVVNVALPSIQSALDVEPSDLQWAVVAYGVAVAGFLLVSGRLGDLVGNRRVLMSGIGLLVAASIVGGTSRDFGLLVGARGLQGLGAALATPNALGIISKTFTEGAARDRALGVFGAAGGAAAVAGSVAGGLLVGVFGWPATFYVNIPAGLLLLFLVARSVPPDEIGVERQRVDVLGALVLTSGLVTLTAAIHQVSSAGAAAPSTLALGSAGLILLLGFVQVQRRSVNPLIPPRVLSRGSLIGAQACAALQWASFLGLIYAATLFVQQTLGWSPLQAGSSTVPIALATVVASSTVAPRVIDRLGSHGAMALGLLVQAAGIGLLAQVGEDAEYVVDFAPAYLVIGLGLAIAQVAAQSAALVDSAPDDAGTAGGALETARELGGAIGLSVVVAATVAAPTVLGRFHGSVQISSALAAAGGLVAVLMLRQGRRGRRRPGAGRIT